MTAVVPYSYNRYGLWNGTSLSTPLVAGALALLIQAHPNWPPYKIYEAAENTATRAHHADNDWGYGILQLAKAMDYPSVSGYVFKEKTMEPISGAELHFSSSDTSGVVKADERGFYLIVNLPDDEYKLVARGDGYLDSKAQIFKVPPDDIRDFSLAPR